MRLDVVSLAPEAFAPLLSLGVIGRAFTAGIAELHLHNPRDHATDRYRKVDDEPYGGGAGMVLKPEPVYAAFETIPCQSRRRVLLMSPQGRPLHQSDLQRWAGGYDQLVLLCGHYEGFDERIRSLADEEVSVGDFVLTGGELPAATIIPAHPVAGTEKSGPDAGFSTLFKGRWCILTPPAHAPEAAVERLRDFWQRLGAAALLFFSGR
jgi:tRNA (guanine-N1)-methyltransferase